MKLELSEADMSEVAETAVRNGRLVIISSPSGGGKGTLIRRLLQMVDRISYSVSWTTRQPRVGEADNRDYHFVSTEKFEEMRRAGAFLETACVHGNFYGTAQATVEIALASGHDIVLEIDVQGAKTVQERVSDTVSIFILPPSFDVLKARLTARNTDRPDDLTRRLRNSRGEVEQARRFDYIVLNDEAERAARELVSIIEAERVRMVRRENLIERVLATFPNTNG